MSIRLRRIKKSDIGYFLKWWKDKELINLTSGIYEKSDEVLANYFLNFFNTKDHHYIIVSGTEVIGHIALIHINKEIFEIQIIIGEKKYWNKGFGQEAIKKAVKIAFGKLGYSKAYLEVRPENTRAIKAYENCGFVKNGFKKYPENKNQPVTQKMKLNESDL